MLAMQEFGWIAQDLVQYLFIILGIVLTCRTIPLGSRLVVPSLKAQMSHSHTISIRKLYT